MVLATSSSSKSQVFSFLATVPMLFGPDAKRRLVRVDATDRMHSTIGAASQRLFAARAAGVGGSISLSEEIQSNLYFEMKVRREHIVEDALEHFTEVLTTAPTH